MRVAAAQFVGHAEKCLLMQRLGNPMNHADWEALGSMLGDVTVIFSRDDGDGAREAVRLMREASEAEDGDDGGLLLNQAQSFLAMFSDDAQQAST